MTVTENTATGNTATGNTATHTPATAADERPVYIPAGGEFVFGIVTTPAVPFNGTALVCLHAGAQNLTSHRGGTYTRLCRELGGQGFMTLRMDFHGSGDSSGVLVNREVGGQTNTDVDAAIRWLLAEGAQRIVMVGTCWGALVALSAAARFEAVESVCLVSPPLRLIQTGGSVVAKRGQHHAPVLPAMTGLFTRRAVELLLHEPQYRTFVLTRARGRLQRVSGEAVEQTRRGAQVSRRRLGTLARRGLERPELEALSQPGRRTRLVGRAVHGVLTVGVAVLDRPSKGSSSKGDAQDTSGERGGPAAMLGPLLKRRVPVHVLVGKDDRTYHDLTTPGALPALDAASAILDVVPTPVSVHGLSTLEAQDVVVHQVQQWVLQDLPQHAVAGSTTEPGSVSGAELA